MKLLDASSKKIVDLNKNSINIYLCGPTVYNDVHIGNIRPPIIFDVLHRYLIFKKIDVNYISNITDIDDKIVNKAIEKNLTELEVSNFYFNEYLKILTKLNLLLPNMMPKVTENIDHIKKFIADLIKNNHAYIISSGIYFDISKISKYGELFNINVDENQENEEEQGFQDKRNPADFALWKFTSKGITWEFEYGVGRPGWHTECVAMINRFFGDKIDIHGGGIDLRFPHHENENAQSLAKNNCNLADVWMHIGHLNVNNNKMSKSLNNFVLAKNLLDSHSNNAIKWMFFQVNYDKPFNYLNETIEKSEASISKVELEMNKAKTYLYLNNVEISQSIKLPQEVEEFFEQNLNLANITTFILTKSKGISTLIREKKWSDLRKTYEEIFSVISILGIDFLNVHTEEIIELIWQWKTAIDTKKYEIADEIRKKLTFLKVF